MSDLIFRLYKVELRDDAGMFFEVGLPNCKQIFDAVLSFLFDLSLVE
jgi:hypothetical protein